MWVDMAKRINLNKVGLVEIVGGSLVLEVEEDAKGRILVRVESDKGGRRINIKQHESDARCIVYSVDIPRGREHLSLLRSAKSNE